MLGEAGLVECGLQLEGGIRHDMKIDTGSSWSEEFESSVESDSVRILILPEGCMILVTLKLQEFVASLLELYNIWDILIR